MSSAPWYEAAILLASVSPVENRFALTDTVLPITCVTAIASPTARPRPRIIAAAMPPRAYGKTTPRTISQRVVPSASAPSLRSRGTPRKSSREMLETIGRIMIVSTTIAVKTLEPVVDGGPKSGMKPSALWSAGSTWSRSIGPSTRIPHRPMTTLGIAASVSTSAVTGPRSQRGASSVRKSAIAMASGVAIASAASDVTTVPNRKLPAP